MRVGGAAAGSAAFFLAGPVLEIGVGPLLLTGWDMADGWPGVVRAAGAVLVLAGVAVVVHCFAAFVRDGRGTPSPAAPPRRLVATGAYRHVRNPMYVATTAAIAGQGLLLGRTVLIVAAAVYLTAMAALTRLREEPALRARHGAAWDRYADAVPGWLPRRRGWPGS